MPASGRSASTRRDATSLATALEGASRSPKIRARDGHVVTHAGSSPSATRCSQNVHLSTVPERSSKYRASYGHASTQYRQPMQSSGLTRTTPFAL